MCFSPSGLPVWQQCLEVKCMGRILVVDDSSTVRLKLVKAVQALGHEVTAVGDGAAALDTLRRTPVDTVLLDIMMPVMDGFEVLAAAKSDAGLKDIPIIVVSALSDTMTSVVKAMELGAEDFLPKDFELPLLKSRLQASVEKSIRRQPAATVSIRAATIDDIPMLLSFVNTAGSGLPLAAWQRQARPGQSPWDVGREIMLDPRVDIYWGNCWIAQTPSGGLGALVFYQPPTPASTDAGEIEEFLRPLEELERQAEGTGHVSFLCTIDSFRGQGIGSALLRFAESRPGPRGMSIIVSSSNSGARALYQRFGYRELRRVPMLAPDGQANGHDWILMFKRNAGAELAVTG